MKRKTLLATNVKVPASVRDSHQKDPQPMCRMHRRGAFCCAIESDSKQYNVGKKSCKCYQPWNIWGELGRGEQKHLLRKKRDTPSPSVIRSKHLRKAIASLFDRAGILIPASLRKADLKAALHRKYVAYVLCRNWLHRSLAAALRHSHHSHDFWIIHCTLARWTCYAAQRKNVSCFVLCVCVHCVFGRSLMKSLFDFVMHH